MKILRFVFDWANKKRFITDTNNASSATCSTPLTSGIQFSNSTKQFQLVRPRALRHGCACSDSKRGCEWFFRETQLICSAFAGEYCSTRPNKYRWRILPPQNGHTKYYKRWYDSTPRIFQPLQISLRSSFAQYKAIISWSFITFLFVVQRPFTYKDNKKIVSLRKNKKISKKFRMIQKSAGKKYFLCAFKLNVIHRRLPPVESLCFNFVSISSCSASLKSWFLLILVLFLVLLSTLSIIL